MRGLSKVSLIAVLAAALALAAGCAAKPVYNVTDAPVSSSNPNPRLEEVGKAIQRAGAALGWQMRSASPGHIVGTLVLRSHRAVVDVNYTPKTYSIRYKDSANLDFDGANIHKNYNGWIQNLDRGIQAQLSLL